MVSAEKTSCMPVSALESRDSHYGSGYNSGLVTFPVAMLKTT